MWGFFGIMDVFILSRLVVFFVSFEFCYVKGFSFNVFAEIVVFV